MRPRRHRRRVEDSRGVAGARVASLTYSVYGLGLGVDRPLSRLFGAPPAPQVDVELTLGSMPPWRDELVESSSQLWQVRESPDPNRPWLSVWKVGGSHIRLDYFDGVDVLLSSDGTRVWTTWPDTMTLDDVSAYLLGPVMGIVLRLRGTPSLHASAVAIGDRTAVFVGTKGAGKSTTAAALVARGCGVVADDVVPLTQRGTTWFAGPGYGCLRLWHDAIGALARADAAFAQLPAEAGDDAYHVNLAEHRIAFRNEALPLGAIYIFEGRSNNAESPSVSSIRPARGLMDLVTHSFANTYLDASSRAREFEALADVVSRVPLRSVRAHTDLARLPELCDLVLDDFTSGACAKSRSFSNEPDRALA
jgi:hypothetical protein